MRALALVALLSAGGDVSAQEVMVAGDSVMAWNREDGRSIADVLAARTGLDVEDVSQSGARLSAGFLAGSGDIRRQVGQARPDILVFDGGANDLGDECGCTACSRTLDEMISPGLEGEITDFVQPLIEDGTEVIYLGYYDAPVGGNEFSPCQPVLDQLETRMRALAAALDGLTFVSGADVIESSNGAHYDSDRVHPSHAGSALLGELVAEAIAALR